MSEEINIYEGWKDQPVNCRTCGETLGYMFTFRREESIPKKSQVICVGCKNIELEALK